MNNRHCDSFRSSGEEDLFYMLPMPDISNGKNEWSFVDLNVPKEEQKDRRQNDS